MTETIGTMLRAERAAFAAFLDTLAPDDWQRESLCAGWRVMDVVYHIVFGAELTARRFFPRAIAAGFSLDRLNDRMVRRNADTPPAELVRRFKTRVDVQNRPAEALLCEMMVHGEDVRRPLGAPPREIPADRLGVVADHYTRFQKKRIAGLRLEATDTGWATGDGPLVTGPALALILAMTGRDAARAELHGPGLDTLLDRR